MIRRGRESSASHLPCAGTRPGTRRQLRLALKTVASRYYQTPSGHALTAVFLKKMWAGWTDSGQCWWCERGRQPREHHFKECSAWMCEIQTLWKEVREASGTGSGSGHIAARWKSRRGLAIRSGAQ